MFVSLLGVMVNSKYIRNKTCVIFAKFENNKKTKVVFAKFGPEHLGPPVSRPRMYMGGVNKEKFLWIGPTGDVTEHFLSLCEKKAMMDASSFAELDSRENISCMLAQLAERKGLPGARMQSVDLCRSASHNRPYFAYVSYNLLPGAKCMYMYPLPKNTIRIHSK